MQFQNKFGTQLNISVDYNFVMYLWLISNLAAVSTSH